MAPEEVVVIEKFCRLLEHLDTFVDAPLHLEHMGQAVQGPQVLRLYGEGLARRTFRDCVVPDLLHRERVRREKVSVAGRLRFPVARRDRGHLRLVTFVTGPEKSPRMLTQRQ